MEKATVYFAISLVFMVGVWCFETDREIDGKIFSHFSPIRNSDSRSNIINLRL
jgi:hypothetical protein